MVFCAGQRGRPVLTQRGVFRSPPSGQGSMPVGGNAREVRSWEPSDAGFFSLFVSQCRDLVGSEGGTLIGHILASVFNQ